MAESAAKNWPVKEKRKKRQKALKSL